MLVVVADEFPQLLLSALQCGVKLLHLIHNVCLLHFQTLAVRFHGCNIHNVSWKERKTWQPTPLLKPNKVDEAHEATLSWRRSRWPLGDTVLFFCSRSVAAKQPEASDETGWCNHFNHRDTYSLTRVAVFIGVWGFDLKKKKRRKLIASHFFQLNADNLAVTRLLMVRWGGKKSWQCCSDGSLQSARDTTETCAFHSCTYASAFPLSPFSLPTFCTRHSNLFCSSYTTAPHVAGHNCNSVQAPQSRSLSVPTVLPLQICGSIFYI